MAARQIRGTGTGLSKTILAVLDVAIEDDRAERVAREHEDGQEARELDTLGDVAGDGAR